MAAGFGGKLLLQRRIAVIEQQVFVVPEIAVTAIFGDEGMGSGVQLFYCKDGQQMVGEKLLEFLKNIK